MLIVWAATGIWHGASWNYLLWGLYFYILLVVEKLLLRNWLKMLPDALRHLYVVSLVLISWAIFALEDPAQLRAYLCAMIGMNGAPLLDPATLYYLRNFLPVLILAGVSSTPLVASIWNRINSKAIQLFILLLAIILCTAYVVASTYNPFLYFRF
jgi:alginate O-acetyltransferase complex protein AlgI